MQSTVLKSAPPLGGKIAEGGPKGCAPDAKPERRAGRQRAEAMAQRLAEQQAQLEAEPRRWRRWSETLMRQSPGLEEDPRCGIAGPPRRPGVEGH